LDQALAHNLYPHTLFENDKLVHYPLNSDPDSPPTRKKCMETPEKCSYIQDLFLNKTLGWMNNYAEQVKKNPEARKPFFLYLSFVLPHAGGWEGTAESGEPVPSDFQYANNISWPNVEKDHASMIEHYLDADFGRILDHLTSLGLDNNTLIVFASDNGAHNEGGHHYTFFNSSGPFRGFKRSLYEGGIRSPTIMVWPGFIKPNTTTDFQTAFWDFLPTFAELAGVPAPNNTDGISIVDAMLSHSPMTISRADFTTHPFLYFEFCTNQTFGQAVRQNQWKLVRFSLVQDWQLYNLDVDIGESNDIAMKYPDIVDQLQQIIKEQHVPNPDFPDNPCISSFMG